MWQARTRRRVHELQVHQIRGCGAFGLREEDRDFLREFNTHLKRFVGTKEHLETVRPFGFTEAEQPGNVTAGELSGQRGNE